MLRPGGAGTGHPTAQPAAPQGAGPGCGLGCGPGWGLSCELGFGFACGRPAGWAGPQYWVGRRLGRGDGPSSPRPTAAYPNARAARWLAVTRLRPPPFIIYHNI